MKLSFENNFDNRYLKELQTKNEEDCIEKTDKLSDQESYVVTKMSKNDDIKSTSLPAIGAGIFSELFQSRNNRKVLLEGIWKLELPNFFFKFAFKEKKIMIEERTNCPICFLLEYTEQNSVDFYFQIDYEHTFPNDIVEIEQSQENKYNELNKENKKDDYSPDHTNHTFDIPIPIDNGINDVVDLTMDQDDNGEMSLNDINKYRENQEKKERAAKKRVEMIYQTKCQQEIKEITKEYGVLIKIFIVGYNFGRYEVELNKGETKCFRINFTDLFIDAISNNDRSSSIIIEVTLNKNTKPSPIKYLGLINEGTTCYMNSLLQILFMLSYFKKSIFQVDISPCQYKTSKIYSMQKLFYELMNQENSAISTSNLIYSFGWSRDQLLVQHDVQEFFIILAEIMEKELKGTNEENTFKHLFEGKISNMIKCTQVAFESKSEETFTDLQLTIKNCRDIYESLDKYTEEELMTGNDQYETEAYGKQDAKKRIMFSCLPRVLILQLKRFEYDAKYNSIEKINDRLEYYPTLNMQNYTTMTNVSSLETEFECHAVVIHVGSINGGHYYCYIQPEVGGDWYKFNDDIVSCVEPFEVFHNNFGGDSISYTHSNSTNILKEEKTNHSNAYLLIYIRKDCLEKILFPINKVDVPKDMIDVFALEIEEREKERKMLFRQRNFIKMDIFTKEIVSKTMSNKISGLTDNMMAYNNDIPNEMKRMRVSIHKDMTIDTFLSLVSKITNVPKTMLYLYKYSTINGLYIDKHSYQLKYIDENQYSRSINNIIESTNNPFYIYIHIESPTYALVNLNKMSIALGKDKEIQFNLEENNDLDTNVLNGGDYSNERNMKSHIYYDPLENNWEFTTNHNEESNLISEITPPQNDHKILIFMKYISVSINQEGKFISEMKLDYVYQMNAKDILNNINNKTHFKSIITSYLSKRFKEIIKDVYEQSEVKYFIEYSCMSKLVTNESLVFQPNYVIKCNQPFDKYNNDGLCIIPYLEFKTDIKTINNDPFNSLRELIDSKAKNELTYGEFDFIFTLGPNTDININRELKIKPIGLNIRMTEEDIQKEIISLINGKLLSKLLLQQESEIRNANPIFELLMNGTRKSLTNLFTKDNPHFIRLLPVKGIYLDHFLSYPLLKYAIQFSHEIKFKIDLLQMIKPSCSIGANLWQIIICDEYSNPIKYVYFERERIMQKTPEMILNEYYPHDETKYQYFFIVHNPATLIAYDIMPSYTHEVADKYTSFKHEIRYQPYSQQLLSGNKIFICVYANKQKPISYPFILYLDSKLTKVKQLKEDIWKQLSKNDAFMSYKPEQDKVKFYQCNLANYSPIDLILIPQSKDDEYIYQIFNHRKTLNVCVNISTTSLEDVKINQQNGNVSNYLSISDKIK